ncbi:MAG: histidine phosphatase family protein [archaeon]|nr:histidine phosphatase family protein [archaeon]
MYSHIIGIDQDRRMYLRDGKMQFGRQFLEVHGFTEGCGAVRDRRGAYFIDEEGRPTFGERYLRTYPYADGIAAAEDSLGMFHLDRSGRPLYTRRFGWVSTFHEDLCAVRHRNGSYTYIDREGRPWDTTYRHAGDFRNGIAVVLDDSGFTHIHSDGSSVHGRHFLEARDYDNGLAPVRDGDGWCLIDRDGTVVSEHVDSIRQGRRGFFAATRGSTFGYLDREHRFRGLFELVGKVVDPAPPSWTRDILDREWDSCMVFMRHAERRSHYICSNAGMETTNITPLGEEKSREIGRSISSLNHLTVSGYCSPVPRCITTANCIMGGMGSPSRITTSQEVGPAATAFIEQVDHHWETFRRPLVLAMFEQLAGNLMPDWFDNLTTYRNLLRMFREQIKDDDRLVLCVNHDCFVMYLIAYVTGRYPHDRWPGYLDGCLVIRRGKELFLVHEGREYPLTEDLQADVDMSLEPTGIRMDLEPMSVDREWEGCPRDSVAWMDGPHEGMYSVCDKEGRFYHGRSDEFLTDNRTYAHVGDFHDQCAPVHVAGRGASFVTDFGDYMHNRWYIDCLGYTEGLAPVLTEGGWQYAGTDGGIAIRADLDRAEPFLHGEALVIREEAPCRIDRNSTITPL